MTLDKLAIHAVNAALFTLCCYCTATLATTWVGAELDATPIAAPSLQTADATPGRAWSDRHVILDRNLFHVSTLAAPAVVAAEPEAIEEELAETRLPLRLLGTVASSDAGAAFAAVEDERTRKQIVVRREDRLLDEATVLRIERRRIVIQNGERREELALDDDKELAQQQARQTARLARTPGPAADTLRNRIQKLSETNFAASRAGVTARNESFSEAQVRPRYDHGQMAGVQVSEIERGSLFEELGVRDGDTVTQVNGIVVTNPQDSVAALRELTEASEYEVNVIGADGQSRTLTYSLGN